LKRSNRLMLLLGVVLAVVAFGGVLAFGSAPAPAAAAPETVGVVTTTVDVPLGTALLPEQLTLVDKPVTEARDTFRDPAEVVGQVVRRPIAAGETLTSLDFRPTTAALGSNVVEALKPGERAIAVRVDAISGVGSLIQTGDYVDVLIAVSDESGKFPVVLESAQFGTVTEGDSPVVQLDDFVNNTSVKVLVQNVQVLGVVEPPPPSDPASVAVDPTTGLPVGSANVVVLSVTAQEAELVRFAQLDGNLSLVMRAPGDKDADADATSGITLRTLVDAHGVLPPRAIITEFP
jgi:pilus assembly protein CpaB